MLSRLISGILHQKTKLKGGERSSVSKETATRGESGDRPFLVTWGLYLNPVTEDKYMHKRGIKMSGTRDTRAKKGQGQQPDIFTAENKLWKPGEKGSFQTGVV